MMRNSVYKKWFELEESIGLVNWVMKIGLKRGGVDGENSLESFSSHTARN